MDTDPPKRYVVTAWRNRQELLQVREDLYSTDTSRRRRALNKVFAWRLRKPDGLPLLLDSTADIVDVVLQDEKGGLEHNALRLLYGTAISRFITGLSDTWVDLSRDKPAWFPPGKTLQLPTALLETRHRIVHRHLPTLAELKRAANDSLDWLWEWYWSQLDYAFSTGKAKIGGSSEERERVREKVGAMVKIYVKERKGEIKSRKDDGRAVDRVMSMLKTLGTASSSGTGTPYTQEVLLDVLVTDRTILPADKKLGTSMSGAFIIWSPLLLALSGTHTTTASSPAILQIPDLLANMLNTMNARSTSWVTTDADLDPTREGMYEWILHVLTSSPWTSARTQQDNNNIFEDVLAECFSAPSAWNLKLTAAVLEGCEVPYREEWRAVLRAARGEGEGDDVDGDGDAGSEQEKPRTKEKDASIEMITGPRKVLGMWRPRPIGWRPEGWSDDE